MGIILRRPMTSGVSQRLMGKAFPKIDVLDVALSDVHRPRSVDPKSSISGDTAVHTDVAALPSR